MRFAELLPIIFAILTRKGLMLSLGYHIHIRVIGLWQIMNWLSVYTVFIRHMDCINHFIVFSIIMIVIIVIHSVVVMTSRYLTHLVCCSDNIALSAYVINVLAIITGSVVVALIVNVTVGVIVIILKRMHAVIDWLARVHWLMCNVVIRRNIIGAVVIERIIFANYTVSICP